MLFVFLLKKKCLPLNTIKYFNCIIILFFCVISFCVLLYQGIRGDPGLAGSPGAQGPPVRIFLFCNLSFLNYQLFLLVINFQSIIDKYLLVLYKVFFPKLLF